MRRAATGIPPPPHEGTHWRGEERRKGRRGERGRGGSSDFIPQPNDSPVVSAQPRRKQGAKRKEGKTPRRGSPVLCWPKGAVQSFNLEFAQSPSASLLRNSSLSQMRETMHKLRETSSCPSVLPTSPVRRCGTGQISTQRWGDQALHPEKTTVLWRRGKKEFNTRVKGRVNGKFMSKGGTLQGRTVWSPLRGRH